MKFLKILFFAQLFFTTLTTVLYAQKRPNILLINIDDMGWKDVGFMGSTYYETPHIDSLSKRGVVFTNAYAGASNCAPSRASMLTGKWTTRHQIYTVGTSARGKAKDRKLIPVKNKTVLSRDFQTIAQLLQKNGYTTCSAGKWHLSKSPINYGFDVNIGGGANGHPKSYYPPYKNVPLKEQKGTHLTDAIMTKVCDFVRGTKEPFFLYYAPYAVHTPIQPVQKYLHKYVNKPAKNGQRNANYATMIENLDNNIGRLIALLKTSEQFKNTLIIFTSDNGGLYGITDQRPLRAGKGSYYEGGIRVPLFFVWQGHFLPRINHQYRVTHLDIFPTLLKIAGLSTQKITYDGVNLLPLLKENKPLEKRALFWHFPVYLEAYLKNNTQNRDLLFRTRPGSVVIKDDWKLHYYFEDKGVELYHLPSDPSEKNNLALQKTQQTKVLLNDLKKWWQTTNAVMPTKK